LNSTKIRREKRNEQQKKLNQGTRKYELYFLFIRETGKIKTSFSLTSFFLTSHNCLKQRNIHCPGSGVVCVMQEHHTHVIIYLIVSFFWKKRDSRCVTIVTILIGVAKFLNETMFRIGVANVIPATMDVKPCLADNRAAELLVQCRTLGPLGLTSCEAWRGWPASQLAVPVSPRFLIGLCCTNCVIFLSLFRKILLDEFTFFSSFSSFLVACWAVSGRVEIRYHQCKSLCGLIRRESEARFCFRAKTRVYFWLTINRLKIK
jgi:hypothetical protein